MYAQAVPSPTYREAIVAYSCPQSIRGVRVRITRLNECGVPLDPLTPNSRIQFAAFTKLTLSPDTSDGADITVRNAAGQICIRDKDCPRLLGFDATLVLCGMPLPALEMLLDLTLLHSDTPGDFKGAVLRNSKTGPCPNPKMIEIWSKNANRDQCGVGGTGSRLYTQFLAAHTKNWEVDGDFDFNYDNPLEISLSGYVENNPNFFPSWPGADFPSYVPGGGDPTGVPTGPAPPILPNGITADTWTLLDQDAIQDGGPIAWQSVGSLPTPVDDCEFVGVTAAS